MIFHLERVCTVLPPVNAPLVRGTRTLKLRRKSSVYEGKVLNKLIKIVSIHLNSLNLLALSHIIYRANPSY